MAKAPHLKIYNSVGDYIGCVKHYEDAACLIASYGAGAEVRLGHSRKHVLWREGDEGFPAGESYDGAGAIMRERENAIWSRAAVKTEGGA